MLANLLNVPTSDAEWQIWSFSHRDSHVRIRQAIQTQKGVVLPDYQLDPIFPQDMQGWLQRNSQTHNDMDGALGAQGTDLLDVDFNDEKQVQAWMFSHYQEHFTAEQALGI